MVRDEEDKRGEREATNENIGHPYRATTMITNEDLPRMLVTDVRVTEGPAATRMGGMRNRDVLSKRNDQSLLSQARDPISRGGLDSRNLFIEEDKLE